MITSIFDPLGFVAPVILPAKKLLQNLCRKYDLTLDQPTPKEHLKSWRMWLQELLILKDKLIERCLKMRSGAEAELHCFSDAFMVGTAAVAYLRQKQAEGRWLLRFVMAKAKVSPAKVLATIS